VPGDAKALVKLRSVNGQCLVSASQNKDRMKAFELKKTVQMIPLQPLDVAAIVKSRNGKKQKRELNYGSSHYHNLRVHQCRKRYFKHHHQRFERGSKT
jgi:hypothetical protein